MDSPRKSDVQKSEKEVTAVLFEKVNDDSSKVQRPNTSTRVREDKSIENEPERMSPHKKLNEKNPPSEDNYSDVSSIKS